LTKACNDLENDERQRYDFCKNQIALESKIWQDEIMFTELMKNENTYIKRNVLNFLHDMAKLEKDNNDHIQSLKSKVEREKYDNMKQVEKYYENLGELKRVIEVKEIEHVLEFKKDLEQKNTDLEKELNQLKEENEIKKTELHELTEKMTAVEDNSDGNYRQDKINVTDKFNDITNKLNGIDSEIAHLEEPLDKIMTCVGRMQHQLKSDNQKSEINISVLRTVSK